MFGDIRTLDVWRVKIIKIVNDRDLPNALREQPIDKMRTNKSGSAGDKYLHFQFSSKET